MRGKYQWILPKKNMLNSSPSGYFFPSYVFPLKFKFKSGIFKSSNKYIFYNFFYKSFFYFFLFFIYLFIFFFIYMKMSKNLLAKYYQENKERLQKKSRERYQNLSKEEKEEK